MPYFIKSMPKKCPNISMKTHISRICSSLCVFIPICSWTTGFTNHVASTLIVKPVRKMTKARASWQRRWVSQIHMRRIHRIKDKFRHMWHCQRAQTSLNIIRHHTKPFRNSLIRPNTYTSSWNNDQFKFQIISRYLMMFWTQASIPIMLANKMLGRKPVAFKISLCMIYKVIFIQFQRLKSIVHCLSNPNFKTYYPHQIPLVFDAEIRSENAKYQSNARQTSEIASSSPVMSISMP